MWGLWRFLGILALALPLLGGAQRARDLELRQVKGLLARTSETLGHVRSFVASGAHTVLRAARATVVPASVALPAARGESAIADAGWRERALPQGFGGPHDSGKVGYPTIDDLRLCERAMGNRPGGPGLPFAEKSAEGIARAAEGPGDKRCTDPTCAKCMMPVHRSLGDLFNNARANATLVAQRRATVRAAFGTPSPGHPVLLFSTNFGALTNFANWACSVVAGGLNDAAILSRVVVVATEQSAAAAATAAGFAVLTPEMFGVGPTQFNKAWITETRQSGATGVHGLTLSMSMNVVALSFLLDEGYDVLVQDTDVVWTRSPIECATRYPNTLARRPRVHVATACDHVTPNSPLLFLSRAAQTTATTATCTRRRLPRALTSSRSSPPGGTRRVPSTRALCFCAIREKPKCSRAPWSSLRRSSSLRGTTKSCGTSSCATRRFGR